MEHVLIDGSDDHPGLMTGAGGDLGLATALVQKTPTHGKRELLFPTEVAHHDVDAAVSAA